MQILTIPGLFMLLYINDLVSNSETCEPPSRPHLNYYPLTNSLHICATSHRLLLVQGRIDVAVVRHAPPRRPAA
jgi:hypothetical protein